MFWIVRDDVKEALSSALAPTATATAGAPRATGDVLAVAATIVDVLQDLIPYLLFPIVLQQNLTASGGCVPAPIQTGTGWVW